MVDWAGTILATSMLAVMIGMTVVEQQAVDGEVAAARRAVNDAGSLDASRAETMVGGYLGAPYTYPSDVRLENPATKTDFTLKHASWEAKPFKSPIYYGVRIARWNPGSANGYMVDFTHSKTITRPDEAVDIKGLINGAPAPARAKVGDLFKHLEFSHGHNMLTANVLFRLGSLTPRLSPYVGVGGGVSLPHTEVQMIGEPSRTYEYQYVGPVAQALAGLEVRLGTTSLFFEYKFSFADQFAPLSRLDGDILFTDLWRQFKLWWGGTPPPGGHLSTRLTSHNFIGGVGVRF
jgi:hypothetical protein